MHTTVLLKNTIAAWLLPPGLFLLLIATGLMMLRKKPRLGRWLIAGGLICLTLLSLPLVANRLQQRVEPAALQSIPADAAAIICLGGGKRYAALDQGGGETINNATLTRLRYTAQLARQSGLPVLVTGGKPLGGISEAELMAGVLRQEFNIPVRWVESNSVNTEENARLSARLLPPGAKIILVTQAVHMSRAQTVFTKTGFKVIPAATDYTNQEPFSLLSLQPKATALSNSSFALHELLGMLWYKMLL